ncbi:zf-HC2 domain-containing protein [Chitinophaga sancti]|uniref:Tetratricopeptide repeat-containing protein n=1 Tax=Chitinophaga sancti TaxID=1004 RepID=A0A1K1RAP2_9BACT|nr:zf-HC2 domain-containing protein [Chitinophaga sancti]WQD65544.1 zf-HC2 domain-containing protein [Chitinophaga sancti]WQG88833.1 zf-HC2 domain-containing protein [Chitinophaga sancti]SFW69093.1 Tetratricopeptide repeat-containing protein [Chitinophaga sancti]
MQPLENKDKIFKIFSKVRCFSKDQLPRYVDGRLTHVEKHLLEQHLVNCELCSSAVEILQKPKYHAQYQPMGVKVQELIRSNEIAPVYETERYQKRIETQERFLTYFWSVVAAALVTGLVFLITQQTKTDNFHPAIAKTETIAAPETASPGTAHTDTVASGDGDSTAAAAPVLLAETGTESDQSIFKTAMAHYYKGKLDEAIPLLTKLTTDSSSSYGELARYQLAMCYKYKKQKVKARNMFTELVKMDGRMKKRALLALNNL